jgi:hypothetical protein
VVKNIHTMRNASSLRSMECQFTLHFARVLNNHERALVAHRKVRFPLFTLCGVWLCSLRSITKAAHQARARTGREKLVGC